MSVVLRQVCSHAADECSLCAQHHDDNISQRAFGTQERVQVHGQCTVQHKLLWDCWGRGVQG